MYRYFVKGKESEGKTMDHGRWTIEIHSWTTMDHGP